MSKGHSNQLVKQVGEHLVCAELGRMGLHAAPFAGNVRDVDVVASDGVRALHLQVKTARWGKPDKHAWNLTGCFLDITTSKTTQKQTIKMKDLGSHGALLYVLVMLKPKEGEGCDTFYVLSGTELQRVCHDTYHEYMKPRGYVRPKSPESCDTRVRPKDLERFKGWAKVEQWMGT